jgi:predicted MPP superfamily phosphohydrolase
MNRFRWLHLTDLHWGSNDHKDLWGTIQPKWFDDIDKIQEKCGGPWDAVFFTGDLVNKGKKEEFTALTERLKDLFNHLKANGSEPCLIVVPGNHDLVRPNPNNSDCKMLTKYWEGEEDVQNAIWRKDTKSEAWKMVQKAHKNFTRWYEEAAKLFKVPSGMKPGLLPGEFSVSLTKGSHNIGVLGLNTAFLQLDEGDFKGKLDAHAAQVTEACGDVPQRWVEKHDACLLLTHHPMDWLTAHGQDAFKGVIAPSGRFALHLCGHQHEARMQEEMLGGSAAGRRYLCGTSIFGMETYTDWQGKTQKDRLNGYSAGSIDFSLPKLTLRIWPRFMNKKGDGVWGFNQDTSFHLENDESIEPILFKSTRKKPPSVDLALEERGMSDTGVKGTNKGSKIDHLEPSTEPSVTDIGMSVKKNICKKLEKPHMKCLLSLLQQMFSVNRAKHVNSGHIVDRLVGMDLLGAIIELHKAVDECIVDLINDGSDHSKLTRIWDDCVTILGWLVLTGVQEAWASKAALEMAQDGGTALELMIPVETEVGIDIAVSRIKGVKANFSLDEGSLKLKAGGRIPSEKWQIEMGWSLEEKVLTVKKQLWKQLYPLDQLKQVPISDEKLTRDLRQTLKGRRKMGKNHYMVVNLPDTSYPGLEADVYRALMADLQNLDIFYLGAEGEEGLAIVAETELQTQIREFLLIKRTIRMDK